MALAQLSRRVLAASVAVCTAGVMTAAPAGAHPASSHRHHHHARGHVVVLDDQLSSPKGITIAPNGDPVVGQGAFGAPGPVLDYVLHGRHRGTTVPLTDPLRFADVAAAPDGTGWALGAGSAEEGVPGDTWLYHRAADGTISQVVDIAAYQATDPDPEDQDDPPFPTESNPYGLAATHNGDALVTDAANNDLLRVTPAGDVTTVARFGTEPVSTDQLPADERPPVDFIDAEAVPTTVTIGPDGYAYVGELKGFPFRTHSSRIWRINPRANGAHCAVGASTGGCHQFARGFTAIQDIAFNRHTGSLYVLELAKEGVAAFEAGLAPGGTFPAAVLLKVAHHRRVELARGQLSQPGGVAVGHRGGVFVTDQVFTGGRLSLIRP
jgi:hypothetical protein